MSIICKFYQLKTSFLLSMRGKSADANNEVISSFSQHNREFGLVDSEPLFKQAFTAGSELLNSAWCYDLVMNFTSLFESIAIFLYARLYRYIPITAYEFIMHAGMGDWIV